MDDPVLPRIVAPNAEQLPSPIAIWRHLHHSGQFEVRIDLIRGVGRAGATPDVALTCLGGERNGVFGLGWTLNLPAITRGNGRQLPRYRDSGPDADTYSGSECGELVPARFEHDGRWLSRSERRGGHEVTEYRPRAEMVFDRIERHRDVASGAIHWVTISRDHVIRIFGRSAEARLADPADPSRVARWLLEEQRDSRGHIATFSYKREDLAGVSRGAIFERHRLTAARSGAQLHPKRVRWGNSHPGEPGGWLFELVFDYGEHMDDRADESGA